MFLSPNLINSASLISTKSPTLMKVFSFFKVWLSFLDRVFASCEQVKALVSVGCCYNLLSEDSYGDTNTCSGFPMSKAAKLSKLALGKSIRDLACQV